MARVQTVPISKRLADVGSNFGETHLCGRYGRKRYGQIIRFYILANTSPEIAIQFAINRGELGQFFKPFISLQCQERAADNHLAERF